MNSFNNNNLKNIKNIFEEKTGVELTAKRTVRQPIRTTIILTAVIACFLTMTAFAISLFSALSGDDLGLYATYEGNGIVSIVVENRSEKELNFQSTLKLMRWNNSEEIDAISDNVFFDGTKIPPNSSGTMTIDLSSAYDVVMLEKPLVDDHYYFVLTNNNFIFGQDWMCSVEFAEVTVTPPKPLPPVQADDKIVNDITENLQFYFNNITFDFEERRTMDTEYMQALTEMFNSFDGNIVQSVSPLLLADTSSTGVIFDNSIPSDEQHLLVDEHWHSHDANFKLLTSSSAENALVLSAALPLQRYEDTFTYLPLLYIFTFEKSAISDDDYVFIYGQLLHFSELEEYRVYEDEKYVCYEMSDLMYSDLMEYVKQFVSQNADIRFDEQVQVRVENICNYYKENIGNLFYYK